MKLRLLVHCCLILLTCLPPDAHAQRTPLTVAASIGDKLIRETPFRYRLTLRKQQTALREVEVIDLSRSLGRERGAAAYAVTGMFSPAERTMTLQIAHGGACTIWLNGRTVYERRTDQPFHVKYGERSLEMSDSFWITLRAGLNHLLIRSATHRPDWKIMLQPTPDNGAILTGVLPPPELGLSRLKDVDASVAALGNWLLLGPLPAETRLTGLEQSATGPAFGSIYSGINGPVTWRIPTVDVLGDVIDPLDWGTNYNWNYHNGGVAWAMQHLTSLSGDRRFAQYANDFCDFHLRGRPFVTFQVETLNAFQSANSLFINTPLLDFTLAPSLPFVRRLQADSTAFSMRPDYQRHVDSMIKYATDVQLRMPGSGHYVRTTPIRFTTWVDDMFMGIPFLVEASRLTSDTALKRRLVNDAADQIIAFNREVFDDRASLYMHARYSNDTARLPHWSRANGWGIWATTELLQVLSPKDPRFKLILNIYRRHVDALAVLQDPDGFWLNVLDRMDAPRETSGTAIFTMAIARGLRLGWISGDRYRECVRRGWSAVQSRVEVNGTVHDICMGTMCSGDVGYYMRRPLVDNDTHGLFAVLFACMEVELLQRKEAITSNKYKRGQ